MSRHGILQILSKGILPVVCLVIALAACNNCSPKVAPGQAKDDVVVVDHIEKTNAEVDHMQKYNRPAEYKPVDDQTAGGDVFRVNDGGDDPDLGDGPDIGADYPDDDTPVTPSHSGKTTRPSVATDFDPFSGEGDDEPAERPALNADDYKVALDVTNEITLGSNATLRVWIGLENYLPKPIPTTSRDTTTIPASLGDYARITPYAPDFMVGPEESQVMRIVPSGSSVLFSLTPEKEGEFLISARIELYDNPDLMGIAVPKTSDIVSVVVKVDTKAAVKSHLGELGTITWSELKKFWAAIVAVFFGAILFLFRKFVRKKTGYSADGSEYGGGTYTPSDPAQTTDTSASGGDAVDDPFADGADTGGDLADTGDEPEDPFA